AEVAVVAHHQRVKVAYDGFLPEIQAYLAALPGARQTVAQFDEANRELIEVVAAEVAVVAHHQRVKVAYDGFLPEIQAYLAALPG
ncbi:hypothetical protein, partial [Escherichia coli]|uniref:hypothetical protein n=1 Tax=Escherichia coli TaxID=562 RepID=UPI000BCE61FA